MQSDPYNNVPTSSENSRGSHCSKGSKETLNKKWPCSTCRGRRNTDISKIRLKFDLKCKFLAQCSSCLIEIKLHVQLHTYFSSLSHFCALLDRTHGFRDRNEIKGHGSNTGNSGVKGHFLRIVQWRRRCSPGPPGWPLGQSRPASWRCSTRPGPGAALSSAHRSECTAGKTAERLVSRRTTDAVTPPRLSFYYYCYYFLLLYYFILFQIFDDILNVPVLSLCHFVLFITLVLLL